MEHGIEHVLNNIATIALHAETVALFGPVEHPTGLSKDQKGFTCARRFSAWCSFGLLAHQGRKWSKEKCQKGRSWPCCIPRPQSIGVSGCLYSSEIDVGPAPKMAQHSAASAEKTTEKVAKSTPPLAKV